MTFILEFSMTDINIALFQISYQLSQYLLYNFPPFSFHAELWSHSHTHWKSLLCIVLICMDFSYYGLVKWHKSPNNTIQIPATVIYE